MKFVRHLMFWQCVCTCAHGFQCGSPTHREPATGLLESERHSCFCFWHTTEESCSSLWNTHTYTHLHTLMTQTIPLELRYYLSGKAQNSRLIRACLNIDISCDPISAQDQAVESSQFRVLLFGDGYSYSGGNVMNPR